MFLMVGGVMVCLALHEAAINILGCVGSMKQIVPPVKYIEGKLVEISHIGFMQRSWHCIIQKKL